MEVISRASFGVVVVLLLAAVFPAAFANSASPAPAPFATSDGTAIDQGIAYLLMLVALALTYLIH
uniref:Putative arabinogalactan protein 3 n=1 Tax=Centaurium erythraea TaxID=172057 RepID=R9W4L4_CENER|nr:putative arabinogalactan protein 3 [Centaurium erythraea]UKD60032.1 arabinogalactan protein 3 [Centaurium erythraea]